ncbi:MAG: orotidine 5'-phosphate decarboxylase / HUMPS family protein [Oligoflexus sp.]
MASFIEKWREAVRVKNSCLCVGIDPAHTGQRQEQSLASSIDKLEWTASIIEKVAPFAAAIKLNRNYYKDLSQADMQRLNRLIHQQQILSIDDSKLADIGETNDTGLYHAAEEGFDSVTYAPFPGNIGETAAFAKDRGIGLIMLVLMSNPEYELIKNASIQGMRAFEYFARQAAKHQIEAVVVGAPSPKNHVMIDELQTILSILNPDQLVLVPGVGAQGGNLEPLVETFGDRAMINVGRSIIYHDDPAGEAQRLQAQINRYRR